MAIINCIDCGREYDNELKACPDCGCPTASQITHAEQMPRQTAPIQNLEQPNENGSKKTKNILWILPMMLSVIVALGIIYYHGHSYDRKMAQFNRKAAEFKASLDSNCQVISETIDSMSQKVFYIEKNTENYDYYGAPYHKILMHDYATGETKPVLPYTGEIDDYNLCGVEFINSKLIKDRLFLMVRSNCMWRLSETGIFYVNIRDNTLHYVESCNKAEFIGLDEMCIHKYFDLRRYENEGATEYKEYHLSTMLDDAEYAENRQKLKKIGEDLAEEWWRKEEINSVKEWLIGTWEWTGYIFGIRTWARLIVSDNSIVLLSPDGILDQGAYSVDYEANIIHYGNYSYVEFDPVKKRLFDRDNGKYEYYNKVSNSTTYSSESYGSRNAYRNGNNIVEQLEKLDNEEDNIISIVDPIRRSGQFYPDILAKVMRMKQINDERIRLARQLGDPNLIQYYESKKMRSEATIRSWGFG